MLEIRTYTLRSREALDQYATEQWARHIPSLAAFGITTRGVWREVGDDGHRLVALVEYPDGADPRAVTESFMASPEFAADMSGFPVQDILAVDSTFLEPAPTDPGQR